MTDGKFEPDAYLPNPFVDSTDTKELEESADETNDTTMPSQIYFDEESGELKQREVTEEELSEEELEEKSRIAELRTHYKVMKRADDKSATGGWSSSVDEAKGNLIAALKEKRSDVNSDIDDLRFSAPEEEEEELKSERQSINSEIAELEA